MEKSKKIIFIIAIIGIIGIILFTLGSIVKVKIEANNDGKEFEIGKNLIIGTWIYEKRNQNSSYTKTLNINDKNEFVFKCEEEENNKLPIKYTIKGKCYLSEWKNKLYKKYRFDREQYEDILNAPEKTYNWKEYLDKDAPTATIENNKLILFGESYSKKD